MTRSLSIMNYHRLPVNHNLQPEHPGACANIDILVVQIETFVKAFQALVPISRKKHEHASDPLGVQLPTGSPEDVLLTLSLNRLPE